MNIFQGDRRILIETSVLKIDTGLVSDGVWSTAICQDILVQTNIVYTTLANSIVYTHAQSPTILNEKQRNNLIDFCRKVLNPFIVKWHSVFFTRKNTPKLWTRRKYRKYMKSDFLIMQECVDELCEEHLRLQEEKIESEPGKAKRGIN